MTVYYHGTPITPRSELYKLTGKNFCVSFMWPNDIDVCLSIGQSVLMDNGAFSAFTKGKTIEEKKLYQWLETKLRHPHKAIILDVIGGDVDQQREARKRWPFSKELSWAVWHLDKPMSYLQEIVDEYGSVCFGSAGEYWQIGTDKWMRRMDEAFSLLSKMKIMPWVHGLRMSAQAGDWPLASVDSTNVARNHNGSSKCPPKDILKMAQKIESVHQPKIWVPNDRQLLLFNAKATGGE